MSELFMKVFNMSFAGSVMILIVLLLRVLMHRNAPKWIFPILWIVVGIRLILPFSIESPFGLFSDMDVVELETSTTPGVDNSVDSAPLAATDNTSGTVASSDGDNTNNAAAFSEGNSNNSAAVSSDGDKVNGAVAFSDGNSTTNTFSERSLNLSFSVSERFASTAADIWLVGVIAMLAYFMISYLKLSRQMKTAVQLRDHIYQSEKVNSPFLMGMVRPRIYLPYHIYNDTAEYIIAHEQAHIRRLDHWTKPLGFVVLAVHWFNPLVWLAYILLCRDIELACDEAVIRNLDAAHRADYSETLLHCHASGMKFAACPVAFGEANVKARIKSILNYKKPAVWAVTVAVIACILLAVCFLTSQGNQGGTPTADTDPENLSGSESGESELPAGVSESESSEESDNSENSELTSEDPILEQIVSLADSFIRSAVFPTECVISSEPDNTYSDNSWMPTWYFSSSRADSLYEPPAEIAVYKEDVIQEGFVYVYTLDTLVEDSSEDNSENSSDDSSDDSSTDSSEDISAEYGPAAGRNRANVQLIDSISDSVSIWEFDVDAYTNTTIAMYNIPVEHQVSYFWVLKYVDTENGLIYYFHFNEECYSLDEIRSVADGYLETN